MPVNYLAVPPFIKCPLHFFLIISFLSKLISSSTLYQISMFKIKCFLNENFLFSRVWLLLRYWRWPLTVFWVIMQKADLCCFVRLREHAIGAPWAAASHPLLCRTLWVLLHVSQLQRTARQRENEQRSRSGCLAQEWKDEETAGCGHPQALGPCSSGAVASPQTPEPPQRGLQGLASASCQPSACTCIPFGLAMWCVPFALGSYHIAISYFN